jgi:hypothetical protein
MRSLGLFLSLAVIAPGEAQAPAGRIPIGTGATIVQTLPAPRPPQDREHETFPSPSRGR